MKSNMKLIKYIDTLLEFAKNQIEFFKEQLNAQHKKKIISNNNNNNNNNNEENTEDNFEELERKIEFEISDENLSYSETEAIENRPNNININNLSNDDLTNFKAFLNENNSCSFDSFLILFINGILPIISMSDLFNNNHYLYDSSLNDDFKSYLKLIHFIKKR